MKKSNITIDPIHKTITISKSFYKKASVYGSNEYVELRAAMAENLSFNIEFKTSDKKTYHGLSFSRMEEYIKTQPDSDKILAKFDAVKRVAKAKGSLYPLTKKWFLNTFPDYKENEIVESETKALSELETEVAAELDNIICGNTDTVKEVA